MHRSSLTNIWLPLKTSGVNKTAWSCCFLTAWKAKAPNTHQRASSASCSSALRTTFKSATPLMRPSTSICCVAKCAATFANHWFCSHQKHHYGWLRVVPRSRISPRAASKKSWTIRLSPIPDQSSESFFAVARLLGTRSLSVTSASHQLQ